MTTTNNNQLKNKMKPEYRSECCNGTVGKSGSKESFHFLCDICDAVCNIFKLDDDQITIEASRHGKPIGFLISFKSIPGERGLIEGGQQMTPDIDDELELTILEPKGYSLSKEEKADAYAIAEEKWMKLCEERKEPS
jgi:hypothetical protein